MISELPIDRLIPQIVDALRRARNLVIEAPPGAGKTTRVPPALLPLTQGREVVVLEPRRIAARMAARRVAQELGESVGEIVGYQVRFEDISGPKTRLRFVTEGVLTRRLLSDARLRNVGAVVLDEFHERHLEGDLALALLRRLQLTERPDLLLIVMSATLEAQPVAHFLHNCPVMRSEGRLFDLDVAYTPYSAAPLEEQAARAAETCAQAGSGDILTFLPGAAEIRRAARACEGLARKHDLLILPLHGDLTPAEQDRAVAPATRRKLILSTNVAESSITIDGVTAVIDSGLARIARDSPWTGLPAVHIGRISKASAQQRAGRAARTAPGRAIRLYTADDFHRRPDYDMPEILRRELSQLCLDLRAMGIAHLAWLDQPPSAAIDIAEDLLERLRASGDDARRMARLPLHPRLARLVLDAAANGAGHDGCAAAALLGSGARPRSLDLDAALEEEWDPRMRRHFDQIRRLAPFSNAAPDPHAFHQSVLAAFPDRVGRRRRDHQVRLSSGGSATLADASIAYEFLVAVDIEDRGENAPPLIRLCARIQPEWLLDRVQERSAVEWNRESERAEAVSALLYDELVIEETRGAAPDPEAAGRLLAERALEAGVERFVDSDELNELIARIAFASEHAPIAPPDIEAALRELCAGLRSFAELKNAAAQLPRILERRANRALLDEVAPARIRLPGGRYARVRYDLHKPPWVASRLQDFLGLRETPRVARGKVPLVLHLLAPNQRPVQTTTDLAGFWTRLYPQVRRELSRRYPRHKWPEDPYSFEGV